MDLVDAPTGAGLLNNSMYPLRLGYVGVVSKVPQTTGGRWKKESVDISSAVTKNENAYFTAHPLEFGPQAGVSVGTTTLRKKLITVSTSHPVNT
jgi:hypothetical protein